MIIRQYQPEDLPQAVAKLKTQPECFDGYVDVQWIKDTRNALKLETGNRAYQREKVATLSWKQSLICTLLGVEAVAKIPEIHIRVVETNGETLKYELVDGQQRITTILDFINGKFPLPKVLPNGRFNTWAGKTYQEIEDHGVAGEKLCRKIDSYTISCKWYINLSDLQVSHLFVEILNNTNDLKPQEKRCAVLGAFSTWVRDTARAGGTAHEQHELFTRVSVNGDDPVLKYFSKSFKMGRLQVDEWLSELVYLKLNPKGAVNGINQTKHTAWVKEMQSTHGAYTNAFVDQDVMDDLLKLALKIMKAACKQSYQNRLNPMTTQMMVLYADKLQALYGKIDIAQYVSSFFNTWDDWSCLKEKLFADHYDISGKKPLPPFKQLFGGKNANAIGTIFWVLDRELDAGKYTFGITNRDSSRAFPREMVEKRWRAQGCVCYYTEQSLDLEDAVGDHFVPWHKGGKTVWDNLVVTSKFHNSRKGDMTGTQYEEMLEQNAIKSSMQ